MRTHDEPVIPGKLTVRAGGRKLVLSKRAEESERHVLLKALVFAWYIERFPDLIVERDIGRRHKPDLVALDPLGDPVFWAECGETGRDKLAHLVRTLPDTLLVFAKQGVPLFPVAGLIRAALANTSRAAAIELLGFRRDAARFILPDGTIEVDIAQVEIVRFSPAADVRRLRQVDLTGRARNR